MLFIVVLILFLAMLLYLLFVPMVLFIDTDTNEYYIQLKGLAKANLETHEEKLLQIRLRAFFRDFYFYPLQNVGISGKEKIAKKTRTKGGKKISLKQGLGLLHSFKLKRFLLDIDTGNCIQNAKLYPVLELMSYKLGDFKVNFIGRNRFVLHMQNRPIYILKSFINPKKSYYGITF